MSIFTQQIDMALAPEFWELWALVILGHLVVIARLMVYFRDKQ